VPGEFTQQGLIDRFEAITKHFEFIESHLALLSEKMGVPFKPPSSGLPADVIELVRAGKNMEAVKRYRELTNANFEDAKKAILSI
jgi:ribosomal protein L7/L12